MLRTAFAAGALTDGGALLPMLFPPVADLLWGLRDVTETYRFAMRYGASLMFGWTVLLLWAWRRPLERRFLAAATALVISGLVVAELAAVYSGALDAWRMAPTWCLQATLLGLFAAAFHFRFLRRRRADSRREVIDGALDTSRTGRCISKDA